MKTQLRKVAFSRALFAGQSQRDAAITAGYKAGRGLAGVASRLAKDPAVIAELAKLRQSHESAACLQRDEALRILTDHARGSMADFVSAEAGEPSIDLNTASANGKLRLIGKLRIKPSSEDDPGSVEIQLHDPQSAIDRIAKMQGWYAPEKIEVTDPLDNMSDEELAAELQRLNAKLKSKP